MKFSRDSLTLRWHNSLTTAHPGSLRILPPRDLALSVPGLDPRPQLGSSRSPALAPAGRGISRAVVCPFPKPRYNQAFGLRRCVMGLYSHYDGAHNHPVNRALHMIAIPVGFSSLIVVWWHWVIALLLIPTAFALAWLGHLIEGNKPAFLTNPVHVFVAPLWLARRLTGSAPKKKTA